MMPRADVFIITPPPFSLLPPPCLLRYCFFTILSIIFRYFHADRARDAIRAIATLRHAYTMPCDMRSDAVIYCLLPLHFILPLHDAAIARFAIIFIIFAMPPCPRAVDALLHARYARRDAADYAIFAFGATLPHC